MKQQFCLPTKVYVENGIANRVADFLVPYNISKVMIVTDKGIKNAGLLEGIYKNLMQKGIDYVEFDDVKPNPRDKDCDRAAHFAKEEKVNGILAVGGGSVMDTAKAVGVVLTHGGSINDWEGTDTLRQPITPLVCIPTTAGTGSEVTFVAVITDTERKLKMGIVDVQIAPRVALLDPELTRSLPPHITASTGMDALTHAIEAYTSRLATPMTDALALHAIKMIKDNLVEVVQNGSNMEARKNMLVASMMAGVAFGNSDVGSVHCLSEALGGFYDAPHGVLNSIFLPYVFEYNIEANLEKHADVAYALGIDKNLSMEEAAYQGVQFLFELCDTVGIPKFRDLPRVNPADFPMLAKVAKSTPMDASNAREMPEEDYLMILNKAYDR